MRSSTATTSSSSPADPPGVPSPSGCQARGNDAFSSQNKVGRCLSLESILAERAALGPTESWLERETLRVLGRAGLPLPEVQCTLRQRGAFVSRVDFLYRAARIVIEVEGKSHDPDEQRGVDARQRNGVQLLGHAVLTYTYQQVGERAACDGGRGQPAPGRAIRNQQPASLRLLIVNRAGNGALSSQNRVARWWWRFWLSGAPESAR